ncbi:MarR family transcriptional regulator [Streptomyces virginiae]|uniref:MarR family winged helix-turn-helix transcriptional regulator n=1 Tax=Streptomyces virginiae TaxID=1961 RepID=UPI002DD929FA|nr:MarR family transcriptional regulator [Streptomyces virginiae]WSC75551.1 MarR family transcriptional regulator [Streptomyces virginiae]
MPRPGRPGAHEDPAAALGGAAELLAVLHAHGQDGADPAVSPSQLRALIAVEGAEGINLRALGDVLGSRPPSVTRLCDRLEALGLLTRSPHPSSRREVELRLTPRARALLEERRAIRARAFSAVLARMAPEAVDALVSGLRAFREAADGLLPSGRPADTSDDQAEGAGSPGDTGAARTIARIADSA